MSGPEIVFGAGSIRTEGAFSTSEAVQALFKALETAGIKTLDTAQLYGDSETVLGREKAGTRFIIDTKVPGGFRAGTTKKDVLIRDFEAGIKKLGVEKVDIFYIHAPDPDAPIEEALEGINEVYGKGLFERFGLSNFQVDDVEKVYNICMSKGYPLPKVYQGNYSAIARLQETKLFPTLRKLGIAFYAYSPIAGGFLTKSKQQILDGAGRFGKGGIYAGLYNKPAYLEALDVWEATAKEAGCERGELAYRWTHYNSFLNEKHGDKLIIGASSIDQLNQTVAWLKKGPLDKSAVAKVDEVWKTIEHEAPLDNYHK